jgi:circadian clock protein KaiC
MHLLTILRLIEEFHPNIVVIDPISSLTAVGSSGEARAMVTRLVDFLKKQGTTGVYTDLTFGDAPIEQTELGISSLMDVWILLQQIQGNGRRDRTISILKARGIAHSNEILEFLITDKGIRLQEAQGDRSGAA